MTPMFKTETNHVLGHRVIALLNHMRFENYEFEVREGHGGVFIQAKYLEADTYTEKLATQHTRKWLLAPGMTDSEIVSTVFKCCATSMEHRAREGFTYKGARIFGPHFDIEDLAKLCRDGREAAGGRDFRDDHCPDCGRKQAHSADDCAQGLCPKWFFVRDGEAKADCLRTAGKKIVQQEGA